MDVIKNTEAVITIVVNGLGSIGVLFFFHIDWKKFGLLYLISGLGGLFLCTFFMLFKFYDFPSHMRIGLSMPHFTLLIFFSLVAMLGVRYSPRRWSWKLPFYMTIVHLGMIAETWAQTSTQANSFQQAGTSGNQVESRLHLIRSSHLRFA